MFDNQMDNKIHKKKKKECLKEKRMFKGKR